MRIFFHYFLRHFLLFGAIVGWVLFFAWVASLLAPDWVPSWALVLGTTVLAAAGAAALRSFTFRLFGF